MDLYQWVRALQRFAHNTRQAVDPNLEILAAVGMLVVLLSCSRVFSTASTRSRTGTERHTSA